jgi:alpha-galactosidase
MKRIASALLLSLPGALSYDNGAPLAARPPRGWSTWCTDDICGLLDLCFESEVRAVADALSSPPLSLLHYNLILLDDCWSSTSRSPLGQLQPDPARFPSGIPSLVAYLAARNLSLGLYTCAGTTTCKYGRPGSAGHYAQDAITLTGWGVQWIKADNCATGGIGAPRDYFANFSAAINSTGSPIVFHSCEWGLDDVSSWGPSVTQVYRVRPDHLPFWTFDVPNAYPPGGQGTGDIIEGMANASVTRGLAPFAYPDPDFLMTGLFQTEAESMTELSFWALWSAPLIVATDVRNMSAFKASVLGNADVLGVQWDAALKPAARLRAGSAQLWSKPLANGDVAVVLYNAGDSAVQDVSAAWSELGGNFSRPGATVSVYDLWAHRVIATAQTGGLTAKALPPHGSAMWRLSLVGGGGERARAPAPLRASAWVQDRFSISLWVDPIVSPSSFVREYARLASANFTVLLGGFGATDASTVNASLAACASTGLACVPSACETGPDGPDSCVGLPHAWGWQMKDEPSADEFPALRVWADSVSERSPGTLRFINLLPNYASAGALGAATYDAYVDAFVAVVAPDILCFDHYPSFDAVQPFDPSNESNTTQAGYVRNLKIMRAAAQRAGIPFWNFFNAMPFNNRSDVTPAQLRWQAFVSLAYGAKGLLYFTYWTPEGSSFVWSGGIIARRAAWPAGAIEYVEGPHFAHAAALNAKVRAFGDTLLNASSTAVVLVRGGAAPVAVGENTDITSVSNSGQGSNFSAVLGFFSLPSGSRGALVVNGDVSAPALLTIGLASPSAPILENGAPVYDDAPDLPGLQLSIEAGDARLLEF